LTDVKQHMNIRLSTLQGKKIGIDVSIFLDQIRQSHHCVVCDNDVVLHSNLPCSSGDVVDVFKLRHESLLLAGIKPLYVFDMSKPIDNTHELVAQWLKSSTDLHPVCAPYTAELQLVVLEKIGAINGMITKDGGNAVVFGGKNVYASTGFVPHFNRSAVFQSPVISVKVKKARRLEL